MQPIYENSSDDNHQDDIETESSTSSCNIQVKKIDKLKNFFQGSSIKKSQLQPQSLQSPLQSPLQSNICCNLCKDDVNQSNFIILSCNHIFHISCLADIFFKDIYNHDILELNDFYI